jgi:hypothetical protein
MTTYEAREYFKNKGLTYQDITAGDICVLTMMLNKEIKRTIKNQENSVYTMYLSEKIKSKYSTNGSLKECFIFVNAHYFTRRECISFNLDGFIGFAGWSDQTNLKPILRAFINWCDYLAEEKDGGVRDEI